VDVDEVYNNVDCDSDIDDASIGTFLSGIDVEQVSQQEAV
jgi:hypothetical protein